ncbi:hypothetical protein E1A91_D05G330000v1 [Gossypium mustelinum]|uniref:Uncharacterized protein n=1 Tax=Gossypium mustelinum TaxID=34275 RepID=A0A5D2V3W6_GOSMU|nr:hypothetical protein E1A91_D05G330000v1 [Gossypium mustelinum]
MLPPTLAFLPFIQGQSPKSVYSDFLFFCQTNTRFVDLFLVYLPPNQWYRMLSQPYAFNYVLRLRTSTDFKPGHSTFF